MECVTSWIVVLPLVNTRKNKLTIKISGKQLTGSVYIGLKNVSGFLVPF